MSASSRNSPPSQALEPRSGRQTQDTASAVHFCAWAAMNLGRCVATTPSFCIAMRSRAMDPRMTETRPYRPNVGIALLNAEGLVFLGRRFRDDGPEIVLPGLEWQMPQGGVDP